MAQLQQSGQAFLSHAVLGGAFVLRGCVVNFRTTVADIEALPELGVCYGRLLDAKLRPQLMASKLC